MKNLSLELLVIYTNNLAEVVDFYALLGFSFTREKHGNGPIHYATQVGPTVLEIYPFNEKEETQNTKIRLGFRTMHFAKIIKILQENKIDCKQLAPDSIVLLDPDGRKVQITAENIVQ